MEPNEDPKSSLKNQFVLPFNERVLRDQSDRLLDLNQRTIEHSIQIQSLSQQINNIKTGIHNIEINISAMYCHGKFLWRIENFNEKCKQMCDDSKICLYSTPFFNAPNEYMFCIRMNITKHEGKEYVTLNIHLMKGNFDHLLDWPFTGKMTLSILDCCSEGQKKHIIEQMATKPELMAFRKPTTVRNTAGYGFSKFVELNTLINEDSCYIKDNILYVKCHVQSNSSL